MCLICVHLTRQRVMRDSYPVKIDERKKKIFEKRVKCNKPVRKDMRIIEKGKC